jgi:hypothetical protein
MDKIKHWQTVVGFLTIYWCTLIKSVESASCHLACLTCSGPGQDQCLSCLSDSVLTSTSTCECKIGTTGFPGSCIPCSSECRSCVGILNTDCILCGPNKILSGPAPNTCVCDPRFFKDSTGTESCQPCHPLCRTCSGSLSTDCTACEVGASLQPSKECKCSSGNYYQVPQTGACFPCHYSCATCSNEKATSCLSCKNSAMLGVGGLNTCACSDYFYVSQSSGLCEACYSTCKRCSGPTQRDCTACYSTASLIESGECSCIIGQYLDTTNKVCAACYFTCESCSGPLQTQCRTCKSNSYLNPSGECICYPGYIANPSLSKCDQITNCHPSCLTCTSPNNPMACLTCKGVSILSSDHQCLCPQSYSLDPQTFDCIPCQQPCATCQKNTNPSSCILCPAGFTLTLPALTPSPYSYRCWCDGGIGKYYTGGMCADCSTNCRTCSSGQNKCLSCSKGFLTTQQTCQCPFGYEIAQSGKCEYGTSKCPYLLLCGTCTDSSTCTSLVSFTVILGATITCGEGYVQLNSNNKICSRCDSSCKTCSPDSITACTSCQASATLETTSRTCICRVDQYFDKDSGNCYPCYPNCATCIAGGYSECKSCLSTFAFTVQNPTLQTGSCACTNGKYRNEIVTPFACADCHFSCFNCKGPGSTNCYSCKTGSYLQADGSCICKQGYFMDSVGVCNPCHTTCKACDGPNDNNCLSCKQSNTYNPTTKVCECQRLPGTTRSTQSHLCSTPHPSCATALATSSLPTDCLSCHPFATVVDGMCKCQDGYYMDVNNNYQCKPCSADCLTCISAPDRECTTTNPASLRSLLHPKSGRRMCADPSKYDTNCLTCHPKCKSCYGGSETECKECASPSSTLVNGVCECNPGFYSDPSGLCKPCDSMCQECTGPNYNNCTVCRYNEHFKDFTSSKQDCDCYEDDDTRLNETFAERFCISRYGCALGCKTCNYNVSVNECTSCFDTADLVNHTCICKPGYGFNRVKHCEPCNTRCLTCDPSNKDLCTSCRDPNFQNNEACDCVDGFYYDNSTFSCQNQCHWMCKSCTGPRPDQCMSCPDESLPVQGICGCDPGKYVNDPWDYTCSDCAQSCLTCRKPEICTSCKDNAVLVGTKCICVGSTKMNPTTGSCDSVTCHVSCKTCNDTSFMSCTSCPDNAYILNGMCLCEDGYLQFNGLCLKCNFCDNCLGSTTTCTTCGNLATLSATKTCQCPSRHLAIQQNGECINELNCKLPCSVCDATNPSSCLMCSQPMMILNPTTSTCSCPDKNYMTLLGCYSCHSSCKKCTDATPTGCTECFPGMTLTTSKTCACSIGFYPNADGVCASCHRTCATCTSPSGTACLSCYDRATLTNGRCDCNFGTFYDLASNICKVPFCHYSCMTCFGFYSFQCTTCKDGSISPFNGQCYCPTGKYMDENGACQPCDSTCAECVGPSKYGCTVCSTNRVLTADGACECPINTDVASGCLAISTCHQSCLTCFGPNSNNCLTCPQNSLLTQLNTCVCMSSYYLTTTPIWSCTACSLQCSTCSSSSASCTSCDSNKLLYLQGSTCNCPSSYSLSVTPSSAQCTALACHPHCSTCSSQLVTFCTQCQPARLLTSTNACICKSNSYIIPSITSSDPNDILSTAQCQLCSPLCATCTGSNSDQCITCIQNAVLVEPSSCYCIRGYFFDPIYKVCAPCDPSCFTCKSALSTQCTSCKQGYQLANQPVGICTLINSFVVADPINRPFVAIIPTCHVTCLTCSSQASASACLSCKGLATLQSDNSCLCPSGMKMDPITGECKTVVCSVTCLTCDSPSPIHCSSCTAGKSLAAYPLSRCQCQSGYGQDELGNCVPCHPTCKTCSSSQAKGCIDCFDGMTKVTDGSCQCPLTKGMNLISKICEPCFLTCLNCHTTEPNSCYSCKSGSIKKNDGTCECLLGYRLTVDGTCSLGSCDYQCKTCFGQTNTTCLSCRFGAYIEITNSSCNCRNGLPINNDGQCGLCHPTCSKCRGTTATDCTLCSPLATMQPDSSCRCRDGFYFDYTFASCIICHVSCNTCSGPKSTDCTSCREDAYSTTLGECKCNNNIVMRSDGSCSNCHPVCRSCRSDGRCASCYQNAMLDQYFGCMCISGYYFEVNNRCIQCDKTCLECRGPTEQDCISCRRNFILSDTYSRCLCPIGRYYNDRVNDCLICPLENNCISCIDSETCLTCKQGYILNQLSRCSPELLYQKPFEISARIYQDQLFITFLNPVTELLPDERQTLIQAMISSANFGISLIPIEDSNSTPLQRLKLIKTPNSIFEWQKGLLRFTIIPSQDIDFINVSLNLFWKTSSSSNTSNEFSVLNYRILTTINDEISAKLPAACNLTLPSMTYISEDLLNIIDIVCIVVTSIFNVFQFCLIFVRPFVSQFKSNPKSLWIAQHLLWYQLLCLHGYAAVELRGVADSVLRIAANSCLRFVAWSFDSIAPVRFFDADLVSATMNSFYAGKSTPPTSSITAAVPSILHGAALPALAYVLSLLLPFPQFREAIFISFMLPTAFSAGKSILFCAGGVWNNFSVISLVAALVLLFLYFIDLSRHKHSLHSSLSRGQVNRLGGYAFDMGSRVKAKSGEGLRRVIIDEIDIILIICILLSLLGLFPTMQALITTLAALIMMILYLGISRRSLLPFLFRLLYMIFCLFSVGLAILAKKTPVGILAFLQAIYLAVYILLHGLNMIILSRRLYRLSLPSLTLN